MFKRSANAECMAYSKPRSTRRSVAELLRTDQPFLMGHKWSDGLQRPTLILHGRLAVGAFNAVGHQPDDFDVAQHPEHLVV